MSCFRNICGWMWSVYYGDPVEPPAAPTYCRQTAKVDYVYTEFINGFDIINAGGTIAQQLGIAGTFLDFNGVVGVIGSCDANASTQTWDIQVWRPATDSPFVTLGTYTDDLNDTYDIIPTNYECIPKTCYRAVFTPNDVTLTYFTGITVDGIIFDFNASGPFIPSFSVMTSNDFFAEFTTFIGSYFEPDATFDIQLSGNQVTLTICSALEITAGSWGPDPLNPGGDSGNFNFTAI